METKVPRKNLYFYEQKLNALIECVQSEERTDCNPFLQVHMVLCTSVAIEKAEQEWLSRSSLNPTMTLKLKKSPCEKSGH